MARLPATPTTTSSGRATRPLDGRAVAGGRFGRIAGGQPQLLFYLRHSRLELADDLPQQINQGMRFRQR
jgi:hypothetical protein